MSCEAHDWTLKFHDTNNGTSPFEVRPIEMNLRFSRQKYDYCTAKLDSDVGEEMKPETRFEDGALYGLTRVSVCKNGDPIQQMLFRPDWVTYGTNNTHIELHDLQKALADGVIDEQREVVHLEEIYTFVLEASPNNLIKGIKFTTPDSQVRTIYGQNANESLSPRRTGESYELDDPYGAGAADSTDNAAASTTFSETARDSTKKLVSSNTAVDFDEISPQRAIRRLNEMFRLKTWINADSELVVGLPEANQIQHLAAPYDERVWRYKDVNVSHGREPIKSVIVWGTWVDEPGIENDILSWFDEGGNGDVRAIGVANRTDIEYGTTFSVKSTKAKKDALPEVAALALREEMKQQNRGSVDIDPDNSGGVVSDVIDLRPGDFLRLVPDDEYFDNPTATSGEVGDKPDYPDRVCGGMVNNESYLVSEVQHNITDGGSWTVTADLSMFSDVPIRSYMSYFDPASEDWVESNEIGDDGNLLESNGLFESI